MSPQPEYVADEGRALVRVYRLPKPLTNGYCFGAGVPITFQNVDWFTHDPSEGRGPLATFIRSKRYYRPYDRFLVIGDHPELTFMIEPEPSS